MSAKTITDADRIQLQPVNNVLRVDGAPICQVLLNTNDGRIWLRFMDTDRFRNEARGTRYIDVPLDCLIKAIQNCS